MRIESEAWEAKRNKMSWESFYDDLVLQIAEQDRSENVKKAIRDNLRADSDRQSFREKIGDIEIRQILSQGNRDPKKERWFAELPGGDFGNYRREIERFIQDLSSRDPSKDALDDIVRLQQVCEDTKRFFQNFVAEAKVAGRTINDLEKEAIVQDYIKFQNYQIDLSKQEALYRNMLTAVIDGKLLLLPQVYRKNVDSLKVSDKTVSADDRVRLNDIRDLNGTKKLKKINYPAEEYKKYFDNLFGPEKKSEKSGTNGGGSESGDEGVPG